jgi:hypothetical protein
VLRVVLGALILLATMTAIHQHRIGVREANLFRLINDLALPDWTKGRTPEEVLGRAKLWHHNR